jgi:hypothetical protein
VTDSADPPSAPVASEVSPDVGVAVSEPSSPADVLPVVAAGSEPHATIDAAMANAVRPRCPWENLRVNLPLDVMISIEPNPRW